MDQAVLPLNFYCRNARLCLKKANFSRKSQLFHDELSHLHKFEALVGSTIPDHPQFEDKKADKQIVELQLCLADTRKRIHELEGDSNRSHLLGTLKSSPSSKSEKSTPRSKSTTRSPRLVPSADSGSTTAGTHTPKSLKKSSKPLSTTTTKRTDSPKKQQSWGVWTANPHDTTLSPPSKKQISSMQKAKKITGELRSLPSGPKDAFFLPLRSNSPDQSAEAILGGCALLATHLQSFEDGKDDLGQTPTDSGLIFEINSSPSLRRGDQDKRSIDWLSSQSKAQERLDFSEVLNGKDETKSPGKATIGGRRFRFASDFFEKRLQERMSRIRQCPDIEEDGYGSSPSKVKVSFDKIQEEANQEQASSEESLPVLAHSSSTLNTFQKQLNTNVGSSSVKDRLQHFSMEDRKSAENDQLDSAADSIWARKLVPTVEQKLTHEILRSRISPQNSSNGSSRKKHKKRGILGVMDDVIRQAVDSDSDASNATSPQDRILDRSTKSPRGLLKEITQGQHNDRGFGGQQQQLLQPPSFQGLQVEALEKKITSLQSLVCELKGSIEGFTSRVEEEGDTWQCRMEGLEKQMKVWRADTEKELTGIKGSIQAEVQMKLEELTKGLGKAERLLAETELKKETSKQRLESRLEDCSTRLDSLKRQVDSLVSDVKTTVVRDVKDRISQSVQDMSDSMKGDLDVLELGMSKDLENLRKDLDAKIEAIRAESEKARRAEKQQMEALIEEKISRRISPRVEKVPEGKEKVLTDMKNELRAESERLKRAEWKQMEALIEEKIEKRLYQPMEIVSGGKEKVMADIKNELRLLWAEVDLLSKGREEIKDNMEQLTQIAERAKETISKEQVLLKTENGSLKKQLQYFKKESMQTRIDTEDFKKDIELEVGDIRSALGRLKDEAEGMRGSIDSLQQVGDDLTIENKSLRKLVDRMEEVARKVESEAFKKGKEDFEMVRGGSKGDGSRDRMLIMERVEKLSQLYLGGLEEVRGDLMNMKIACEDRMEELENQWVELRRQQESNAESEESLRELVLDGLETRVSHLESKLEQKADFEEERFKVESTLAIIDKDREQAASALAQVADASQKAGQLVSETLGMFQLEMANVKRQSLMIQESLSSEKDAAAAAVSEVMRMRDHIGKEKDMTISIISDAKARTMEFQEGLERERSGLRGSIVMAEKEREAAIVAASEATAAAAKAEAALGEIFKVQRKSLSLSEDVAEAVGQARMKYTKELEGHIEGWRRSMLDEVSKARSYVEGIEEERRKSEGHIEGWRKSMLDEVSKARLVVEGIEEDKRKSLCIAEEFAVQDKHNFEQHMKMTETTIQDLMSEIKEVNDSLDSKLQSMNRRQAQSEQQDEHVRKEIDDIRERMEEAFMRLDKISRDSSQVAREIQSMQAHSDTEACERSGVLKQEISDLERSMMEAAAEQSNIAEKVKKVERTQMDLVRSVEEIQTNTGELEKSGAVWLQKYDAAARVLQEIEKRLSSLENASLGDDPDQCLDNINKDQQIALAEKQRLNSLYKELSGFVKRMRANESKKDEDDMENADWPDDAWVKTFNAKIVTLETRVEHVESEALSNLRVLNAKTEELGISMQTALEGASLAESKCSALGAELVKVFRMLASSRKESPTKLMMVDAHDEGSEQQPQLQRARCNRPHHAGTKSKVPSSHAACTYCKRAAMKGLSDVVDGAKETSDLKHQETGHNQPDTPDNYNTEGHKSGHHYHCEGSDTDEMGPCIDRSFKECALRGNPPPEHHHMKQESQDLHSRPYYGGDGSPTEKFSRRNNASQGEKQQRKGELMEKAEEFGALEHLMRKKNNSELKVFDGKLPITHERLDDKRLECAKKDSTHLGSGKNCQSTNIRLEAGKIQVNVSHRSAVLSGARLTKRGDAISVCP